MKQVKYALTTIVLFCTLFLLSSFQNRNNLNAEELKYNTIAFSNMTKPGGVSYIFELLNYNHNPSLGTYHFSGSNSGYITLAHPNDDAFEILMIIIRTAAEQGWDIGDFNFACFSYWGSNEVVHYVRGSYSPLFIEEEHF